MTRICFLDCKDSFTYNLVQAFNELGASIDLVMGEEFEKLNQNERILRLQKNNPQLICLGPGPKAPAQTPGLLETASFFIEKVPLLGICLGMQAIHLATGGKIKRALRPVHGERSPLTHQKNGLFQNLPSPLWAMRYHSLVIDEASLNPRFSINARCEQKQAMAFHDEESKIFALQFHPESIGTSGGARLLAQALKFAGGEPHFPPACEREGALLPPHLKGKRLNDVLRKSAFSSAKKGC